MKIQVNIKIEKHDVDLIKKVSSMMGQDKSDFIRIAIRKELARLGFLNKQETKALGISKL